MSREEALAAFEQEKLAAEPMTQKEQETPTEWVERAESTEPIARPGRTMAGWALGLSIAAWLIPLFAVAALPLSIAAMQTTKAHRKVKPGVSGFGLALSALILSLSPLAAAIMTVGQALGA